MPFVKRNGIRIHYESQGAGLPLILLPGLGGSMDSSRLSSFSKGFADFRRIGVEPRGHGESDRPLDSGAHRIEQYRDDVLAVMDSADVDRAVIWGFSDGGTLGYAFADAYPNRTRAMIDHDGFDGVDCCDPVIARSRAERARAYHSIAQTGDTDRFRQRAVAAFGLPPDHPWIQAYLRNDPEMIARQLEGYTHWKGPLSVIPRIDVPIAVFVSGKSDPERIKRIQRALGSAVELNVINGVGHVELCMELEHTLPQVREFLHRIPP